MIDFIPPSILVTIGPFPIHFYGLAYAIGLAATYWIMSREARRRGHDPELLGNGLIVVAIAAIIGGRAYHVIDQIAYYRDHVAQAFLPVDAAGNFIGFGGLGVYGGIITGTIAAFIYLRRRRQSFWLWADIVAPGLFAMQAVARWGNFFNQELYGPPTNLPWGIAIQCSHRIVQYACPAGSDPNATLGDHFQPLFLYESLSGLLGVLALMILARRLGGRLRTGDLLGVFFIWYGIVRFGLETLRADNWTFFGVPMAQIFSTIFILTGLLVIVVRHVRRAPTFLVADAAAMVASMEPVGVPGEGEAVSEADLATAVDDAAAAVTDADNATDADAAAEADADAADGTAPSDGSPPGDGAADEPASETSETGAPPPAAAAPPAVAPAAEGPTATGQGAATTAATTAAPGAATTAATTAAPDATPAAPGAASDDLAGLVAPKPPDGETAPPESTPPGA